METSKYENFDFVPKTDEFNVSQNKKNQKNAEELLAKRISAVAGIEAESAIFKDVEHVLPKNFDGGEVFDEMEKIRLIDNNFINKYNEIRKKDERLMEIKNSNINNTPTKEKEFFNVDAANPDNYASVYDENGDVIASYDPSGWSSVPSKTEEVYIETNNRNYGAYEKVLEEADKDGKNVFNNILSSKA